MEDAVVSTQAGNALHALECRVGVAKSEGAVLQVPLHTLLSSLACFLHPMP